MEENNIIVEQIQETIETVEVDSVDSSTVEVSEVSAALGNSNDMSVHGNLSGLTDPDQHPISAITGLRAELDALNTVKTPQTLYSDKINTANYYKWKDAAYDTYGYFVSLVPGESTIKICDGSDIFGVSVETAGFIGNQDAEVARDNSYGLIVTSGLVDVRCASDVAVGDYVVCGNLPNQAGVATKTESGCGYKVIAIEDKNGVNYASISLDVQACTTDVLGARVKKVENDVTSVKNTISQMSDRVGNIDSAINDIKDYSDEARADASDASSKADNALNQAGNAVTASQNAVSAANQAQTAAETARSEAVTAANQALAGVESIDGKIDKLIANVDKYSVGEHSQSYGLTVNLARDILTEGMVYIPIGDDVIAEEYTFECIDENGNKTGDKETFVKEFSPGYYYKWINIVNLQINDVNAPGFWWSEAQGEVYYTGDLPDLNIYDYWFTNGSNVAEGYKKNTLYVKTNVADEGEPESYQWVEEACLAGNANNRLVGLLRSDTDSINLELSNARGDAVTLQERLDSDGARFSLAASKVTEIDETPITVAGKYKTEVELDAIESPDDSDGVYYLVGSALPYNVYQWDGTEFVKNELLYHDGINFCKVNSAAIVGAVNNSGESSLKFSADKIDFTAGDFEINASNIKFDCADEYYLDANHITFGAEEFNIYPIIDGEAQTQEEANFSVDTNGNVSIKGDVHADSGEIAGWTIASDRISKDKTGIYTGTGYNDEEKTEENSEFLFNSLIDGAPKSPVRFYAGKSNLQSEVTGPERLRFTTDTLKELTQTIDMDSGDIPFYDYVDATVLTTTKEHKAVTYTKTISIASGSTLIEGSETYYSITPQELSGFLPADLTKEHVTLECKLHDAESTADLTGVHLEYTGNGAVILDGYMSVANATVEVDVEAVFDYSEQIEARAEFTNTTEVKQIKVTFTPKLVNVKYDIDIEYTMMLTGEAGYQFKVLEDGSLYAGNVELAGRVNAAGGSIGGWEIDESSIFKDSDNDTSAGMSVDNAAYYSLKDDEENLTSPIRFYAGAVDKEFTEIEEGTVNVSFPSGTIGVPTTQTVSLSPEKKYQITSSATYVHSGSITGEIFKLSIPEDSIGSTSVDGGSAMYRDVETKTILPLWLPQYVSTINISITPTMTLDLDAQFDARYAGDGNVSVSVSSPNRGYIYSCTVSVDYEYTEELEVELHQDNTAVTATLTPKTDCAYENVELKYMVVPSVKPDFMVLADGSMYANAAEISGVITATDGEFKGTINAIDGTIGDLQLTQGGIACGNSYMLNKEGLTFKNSSAQIKTGNMSLFYDASSSTTYMKTSGAFKINGQNDTAIELMTDVGTESTVSYTITLMGEAVYGSSWDPYSATYISFWDYTNLWLKSNEELKYDVDIAVPYEEWDYGFLSSTINKKIRSGTLSFKICAGDTISNTVKHEVTAYHLKFQGVDGSWSDYHYGTPITEGKIIDVDNFTQTISLKNIKITGNLVPTKSSPEGGGSGYNLGSGGAYWNTVYARKSEIDLSDRSEKNSIQPLSDSHEQIFDALKPVSYKFNKNNNNRTHIGLIAQDVKAAVESAGLTTQDFAGYCEWEKEDGTIECGLRYGEFIALCIDEIQKLKKRVEELEKEKNK